MKTRHKMLLVGAVLAAIFSPGAALAQSDSLEKQMDVVVKLRIRRAVQSTEETAAGLFVGKDRQNAYFITACHAVIQDDARVQSVQLQFRNSPQGFKALVFEHYDPVLDLAVVQVSVANLPQQLSEIVRTDAALGVPVRVIGHPSAGDWSVASGTVQNMNTPAGDIHHFTTSRDNSLAEGHSGGPVFDAHGGFLGMHTASGPTYGIEAKSAEIVNQLAAWHVPTNNLTTVAAGPTGEVVGNQQAERDAINGIIDAYADSYNRRDAQALWRVWPNPPAQTKRAIEAYFQSARSITMRVIDRRIESDGANATVMAQSSQEFTPKNGSPQKSPDGPITIELEKRSGNWLIHLVR
jgi:ketosteroid isomerase-like protein